MMKDLPQQCDPEKVRQLDKDELVSMLVEQAIAIEQLQAMISEMKQEIERLRLSRELDSKTSSKPPSGDILKKPEKKKSETEAELTNGKRKPGGQPGHLGKTRKGFGRVDRCEILRPQFCDCCGQADFVSEPIKIETQQVAQLVERPIEIVQYHRHTCVCDCCGNVQSADWSMGIIPGQDIGRERNKSRC